MFVLKCLIKLPASQSHNAKHQRGHSHIGCIYLMFLHCAFSNSPDSRNWLPERRQCHTGCIYLTFPAVCFQMCPQTVCIRGCKLILAAFVWLVFSVYLQMCPQIACINGWEATLIAFVYPFFNVHFQLCVVLCQKCIVKRRQILLLASNKSNKYVFQGILSLFHIGRQMSVW